MATIDLGKVKLVWRGTYNGSFNYVPDDVVYYVDGSVGSSYICVANSTGNAPSSGGSLHASWNYLARGQATSPTTTQGDIIVRGASADGRLAIGAAGEALKVNSAGNGLEYGSAAVIKKIHSFEYSQRTGGSNNAGVNQFTWTSGFQPLDPVNNSFWIDGSVPVNAANQDYCGFGLRFERSGGSLNDFNGYGVQYVDQSQSHMSFMGYNFVYSGNFDGAGTYTIYHRSYSGSSHVDAFAPNSTDDGRLSAQTRGFLQIIEFKNP